MQSAETVVSVLRARGRRGLPCDELYRQLYNPALYLVAYGRIYANDGAMTPGASGETADGMSLGRIGCIIDALRHERYRFLPAKRAYIPKKNGTTRPLGLPSWSDKLVGEVVRLLLEAHDPLWVLGPPWFDHLDRHVTLEPSVVAAIDASECSLTDNLVELVAAVQNAAS